MINSPLFTLVEINILIASLGIIFLPRIIYAALSLAFVFINIALLYLLLNAEFLAAAQILIYVGAINVLIVFAIMLVNIPLNESNSIVNTSQKLSIFSVGILFAVILWIIGQTSFRVTQPVVRPIVNTVQTIGTTLLQEFLIPFELLSLLLLVSLVGAITIARKEVPLK
jgi:NAD(P)H-quinone oxidoreductase subunit 6